MNVKIGENGPQNQFYMKSKTPEIKTFTFLSFIENQGKYNSWLTETEKSM